MINAGCEVLAQRGLAFDPPSLTYGTVFQHLEDTQGVRLHRSQVHGRIWDNQDHYRTEVVIKTIQGVHTRSEEVDALVADLAKDTGVENLRGLIEGWVAATVGISQYGADSDLGLDLFIAAQAMSQQDGATSAEISEEATAHMQARMHHNERRYDAVMTALGIDFSEGLGADRSGLLGTLARNAASIVEGARMIESLDGDQPETFTVIDHQGNPQTVDAPTLGLLTMIEELFGFTPDPD